MNSALHAQQASIRFEHFTIEDGLSQSTIRTVMQDREGFIWIGTQDGLNKYDGYDFQIFQFEPNDSHSLSNNFVLDILEDSKGLIWVATRRGGLNSFEPSTEKFTSFQHVPASRFSLASNQVQVLYEDSKHRLWIGTDKGLHLFHRNKQLFTRFPDESGSLPAQNIHDILELPTGKLCLATQAGLRVFDPSTLSFAQEEGSAIPLLTIPTRCLYQDKAGKLWAGTTKGLWCFDELHRSWVPFPLDNETGFVVVKIIPFAAGKLWLGTEQHGLIEVDTNNSSIAFHKHHPNKQYSLTHDHVFDIFSDKSGALWIGCYEGLNKYDQAINSFLSFSHDPLNPKSSLGRNNVRGIGTSRDGAIWVATRGGGLTHFKPDSTVKVYRHVPDQPFSLPTDNVEAVFVDAQNGVWVGTQAGLCKFDASKQQFVLFQTPKNTPFWADNNHVHEIRKSKRGGLWLGTKGGLNYFDETSGTFLIYQDLGKVGNALKGNYVRAIHEDSKGRLWVGTYDGLNCLQWEQGKVAPSFTLFQHNNWDKNSLSYNYVRTIHEDNEGNLWVGTAGGGLNKVSFIDSTLGQGSVKFTWFSTHDGLANNSVYGILPDHQGNLWISTNKELSRFDPKTTTFKNYGLKDGLQTNEFNQGAYHRDDEGNLFFGGLSGLSVFHPSNVNDNVYMPPVVLTGLQLFNQPVAIGKKGQGAILNQHINQTKSISLDYTQNFLTFEFAALNYQHPEHNQYAYFLEGYEAKWNEVGKKRTASYTNLPPGEYTFHVKASNNDHVWNEQAKTLKIIIYPPFWQTHWFKTMVAICSVLIVFLGHKWKVRQIELRKKALEKLVNLRTAELQEEKEHLQFANRQILSQNEEILAQQKELVQKNIKITDSLRYAKTIQKAVLPENNNMRHSFDDFFVIYRPKDIVSGDFYWFSIVEKEVSGEGPKLISIAAVIDCTGHGVPGAFMSLIGNAILNQIVNERKITDGKQILELLNARIVRALKQDKNINTDSMDICLVTVDKSAESGNCVTFSGARRPLYLYDHQNHQIKVLKGARKSIGGRQLQHKPYISETFYLAQGDVIYLTTDGLVDQHNPTGDKFGLKKFLQQLEVMAGEPLEHQQERLEFALDDHQKDVEQRDDITVLGIKV